MALPQSIADKTIVFYDGTCPLCHWLVAFLIKRPRADEISFAPLAGETASLLPAAIKNTDSVILRKSGQHYQKSDAIYHLAVILGGSFALLAVILRWLPKAVADGVYDLVARHRQRFFGDSCSFSSFDKK